MGNKLYEENDIRAIATAIRAKGQSGTMKVSQMPSKINAISTKENVTWHQCPQLVRDYLDNVTYNPNDYSTSQIATYAPATAVQSNTKPIGKTIDGVTYYNEVPNVATPFASTNTAGTLKPLDRLRWINSQTPNMRDLGGWACDGGTVKYGKLFRGGEPLAGDKEIALSLGIRHELNLRGNEIPIRDYSIWGIQYTQFDEYAWSVNSSAVWADILHTIFDCVNHNIPLFFHCAAGADRTGATALLIEAILGVSQSDCDKDYELTCFYSGTGTDTQARRRNENDWQSSINYINSFGGDTFRDRAIAFALSHGITYDEINAFRANLVDGNPEPIVPPHPEPVENLVDIIGYAANTRLSTSGGQNKTDAASGIATFGSTNTVDKMIPISAGDVIRIKGVTFPKSTTVCAYVVYDNTGKLSNAGYLSTNVTHFSGIMDVVYDGDLTTITIYSGLASNYVYMRICGECTNPADVIITVNQEIPSGYTNLVDTIGYIADTRVSMSDGTNRTGATGIASFGSDKADGKYIEVNAGDVIRIKGVTFPTASDGKCGVYLANMDNTLLTTSYIHQSQDHVGSYISSIVYNGDLTTITVSSTQPTPFKFRICGLCSTPSAVIITKNEVIE